MIHTVSSTDPRFRAVHLGPGLNIVLAERTEGSSEKDSRNGLGKTSLIEIIHFCLGAGYNKNHLLAHQELSRFTYSLDFDLGPNRFTVSRCPEEAAIVLLKGPITQLPAETKPHKKTGQATMPVTVWNGVLGRLMFGLGDEEASQTFAPTFRSLIGYFIRRGAHAFSQPFEHFAKQLEWDKQVNTASPSPARLAPSFPVASNPRKAEPHQATQGVRQIRYCPSSRRHGPRGRPRSGPRQSGRKGPARSH